MKTALVTPAWIDEPNRLENLCKFVNYYTYEVSDFLSYNDLIILDNASKFKNLRHVKMCFPEGSAEPLIQRFTEHYDRTSHLDYKYWWRAVYFCREILKEYDKVVFIDNDFFLTSTRICEYINKLDSGWTSFYCKMHNFPETCIQIIHKDCKEFLDFTKGDMFEHNGKVAELIIPFTHVEKGFIGDRYGEINPLPLQLPEHDYFGQLPADQCVQFNIKK